MPDSENIKFVITQYYRDILQREPDKQGLEYYMTEVRSNRIRLEDLKIIFENSEEYKILKQQEHIISQYYREYFRREPDKQGLEYYMTEVRSNRIRLEDLKIIFENSEEYKILKHMEGMKLGSPITTVDGITMHLNPDGGEATMGEVLQLQQLME